MTHCKPASLRPLSLAAVIASLLVAGCTQQPAAAPQAAPSAPTAAAPTATFNVVGSSRDIMLAITIPASDAVFNAATEPPATEEQWVSVERAALALAESGNLLLIPGRKMDDGEWTSFAHQLIDTAVQARTAALAKDIDGVSDAGNLIYEACEGCHKKYMPQPSPPAQ